MNSATPKDRPIRLGTRASPLARWQAEWVTAALARHGFKVELIPITTRGDQEQSGPIERIAGGQGVFTKELQRALLDGRVDLAVHSLKDLPTEPVAGLCLAAVPEREACGDALVSALRVTLDQLPQGAMIGTGSLRRRAQLLHVRPDLQFADVRGNVDTRLRKLAEGQFAALILAEAGLKRLGLMEHITEVLPKSIILPAIGQGALGLETREDDGPTRTAVGLLDDPQTHCAVLAERTLLATLRGGCLAPVGAFGRVESDRQLHLDAVVLSRDGRKKLVASGVATVNRVAVNLADENLSEAIRLGRSVAESLLGQGAADLIQASRT